jgi:DNA mismatch repair protein MutS
VNVVKKEGVSETPLMKQYNEVKGKYPGALVLFRVGDFYETFGEDAITASRILGIVLTKRANGSASHIELAGFPHHSLDSYLPRLVRAGQRVAICDQLEDPKLTKKIVKRGVTELITPGVSCNEKILDHNFNNFLAAIHINDTNCGIAFLDISTGEFMAAEGNEEYIEKLIQGLRPAEVIMSKADAKAVRRIIGEKFYTYQLDDWAFQFDFTYEKLTSHFSTASLKGFGVQDMHSGVIAAGACLHYLSETHHDQVRHIRALSRLEEDRHVWLDRFTIRNLELLQPAQEGGASLLSVLDQTVTPMGSRLLRKWLVLPLKDKAAINERLEVVDFAHSNDAFRKQVCELLSQAGDLERLISRVSMKRVSPREMQQLNRSLQNVAPLRAMFLTSSSSRLQQLGGLLNDCSWVTTEITRVLKPDPPPLANRGNIIHTGISEELDSLRDIAFSGKDYLIRIQTEEQARTGIPSLKVSYNNVFGYYLEVTNAHKAKVPPEWIRKQTLTNAERYITEELKVYEEKILGAEEKINALEEKLFTELVASLSEFIAPVQQNAQLLATVDCLFAFATVARKHHYTKPAINDGYALTLKDVRHPVIEQQLPIGESYIANDLYLDNDHQQLIILTGPNMSGKSAVLRQTALVVIMAQVGCFVPATHATIGLVDKIFTRVGASDNISSGESTFMVEMTETASILNNLSARSLIILDEIGRGTSTYDGVSIAWAIAEFINQHPARPRTLFATHYHELNELAQKDNGIRNFHIESRESDHRIIFLRKLKEGGSEHSFGIHVARMAGVPQTVVSRARQILTSLESQREKIGDQPGMPTAKTSNSFQLSMFQLDDPILAGIRDQLYTLDINTLSPIEALMKLNEIKKMLKG